MPKSLPGQILRSSASIRFAKAVLAIGLLLLPIPPLLAQQPSQKSPVTKLVSPYPDITTLNFLDPDGPTLPTGAVARIGSQRFRHGEKVSALTYSSDGKWLASGSTESNPPKVVVWEEKTGIPIVSFSLERPNERRRNGNDRIFFMEFSNDNRHLILVLSGSMQVWDLTLKKRTVSVDILVDKGRNATLLDVAFSPDQQQLVLLWLDGKLEVRSVSDAKLVREGRVNFGPGSYWKIQFLPNGTRFVLENRALESMFVLEWPSLRPNHEIKGPFAETTLKTDSGRPPRFAGLIFGDNDQAIWFVLTQDSSNGGEILRLDLTTKRIQVHKKIPENYIQPRVLPDQSTILAFESETQCCHILNGLNFRLVGRLPDIFYPSPVLAIRGKQIASAFGGEGIIQVADLGTSKIHPHSPLFHQFESVRLSPDGGRLILEYGEKVHWIDWRTGKVVNAEWAGEPGVRAIHSVSSQDAMSRAFVLAASSDLQYRKTIRFIQTETGTKLDFLCDADRSAISLAMSGNGKRLVVLIRGEPGLLFSPGKNGTAMVWDLEQGRLIHRISMPSDFGTLPFQLSFDGKTLVQCKETANTCLLSVFSAETGILAGEWSVPKPGNLRMAISPNGRLLACGLIDEVSNSPHEKSGLGAVWVCDVATGNVLHKLEGEGRTGSQSEAQVDFSPDSRLLVSGDEGGTIRIFEMLTGKVMCTLEGHLSRAKPRFSPDGRLLVSTSPEAPCYVWEIFPKNGTPFDPKLTWGQLGSNDGKIAFAAIKAMVAHPTESLAMLAPLTKDWQVDKEQIAQWFAKLDADSFDEREESERRLTKVAESIEPTLRKAMNIPNPEVKKRVARILATIKTDDLEAIRRSRVSMALGLIGTAEAKKQLAFWE